jgi:hypothetical protein
MTGLFMNVSYMTSVQFKDTEKEFLFSDSSIATIIANFVSFRRTRCLKINSISIKSVGYKLKVPHCRHAFNVDL